MPVRKRVLPGGAVRWQADYADARRGVPRTRRDFGTRREAEEWLAAVKHDSHRRLIGERPRRLFAQALKRYLEEVTPTKRTGGDDLTNAAALLVPIPDGERGWVRLGELPLEPERGGLSITAALAMWVADQRRIQRRRFVGHQDYWLIGADHGKAAWYWQPSAAVAERPQSRERVTDPALLRLLDAPGGRGPVPNSTLRHRQNLVAAVLRTAWATWEWLDHDVAGRIKRVPNSAHRTEYLTPEQLDGLLAVVDAAFGRLIRGAAYIGWREHNLCTLVWERVRWPDHDAAGQVVRPGLLWAPRTKNGDPIAQPMSDRVEQLLRACWAARVNDSPWVFADEAGACWLDNPDKVKPLWRPRKRWQAAKRAAGIPRGFRFHDLRRTWATHLLQAGAPKHLLQQAGGWKDPRMVDVYARLQVEHLLDALNTVPPTHKPTEASDE